MNPMNRYGRQLQQHWEKFVPERYAALDNPTEYFTNLGEEIDFEIQHLAEALRETSEREDPPNGDYLKKVRQAETARFTAESEILREYLPKDPNEETDQTSEQELAT